MMVFHMKQVVILRGFLHHLHVTYQLVALKTSASFHQKQFSSNWRSVGVGGVGFKLHKNQVRFVSMFVNCQRVKEEVYFLGIFVSMFCAQLL